MIAIIINGLLLLDVVLTAEATDMVFGFDPRGNLYEPDLPRKRCFYLKVHNLLQVQCSNLNLDSLPRNLKTDVEIMDLSSNRLRSLSSAELSPFTSLVYLYLPDNFIAEIEGNAFDRLQNLQVLDLSKNGRHDFPPNILELPALRRLYLSNNFLKDGSFFSGPFVPKSKLELLELSENQLTRLPLVGILPYLTHLNVSKNRISNVTVNEIAHYCSLTVLDLSSNPIKFDSPCDCRIFNAWIESRKIKIKPKFVCESEDTICENFDSDKPIFPNETIANFDSCRDVIRMHAEAEKARSTWIIVGSCIAASLACVIIMLYCIHKRNNKNKIRQRLKQQQQLAANNANTGLLKGDIPSPEQT